MAKAKKWLKFRHKVVRNVAYCILYPYARLKYGIKITKFREQEDRPYLILLNHQTPFDQFFMGMAFKGPVYYVATEDIFSLGVLSSVIRYLVAPIPIRKQTTDVRAVMNCLKVAKEGGSICMAPEGNRTYSGKTEYMNPAVAPLIKKLKLPVVLFRIEGGYGAEPRWSDVVRKGKMKAYVSRIVSPEEYADLTDEQLYEIIKEELFVNEAVADSEYPHKKCAEYLERAVYVCPFCGLSSFESHKNTVKCKHCDAQIIYTSKKELKGINCNFPFNFVNDWYEYQEDFVNKLNLNDYTEIPVYTERAQVREVIVFKKKNLIHKDAEICLFGDRICVADKVFAFDDIHAVTVLGKNKLNIYINDEVYQLKGNKRFNALKYVHFFYRYKNIKSGKEEVFLGI